MFRGPDHIAMRRITAGTYHRRLMAPVVIQAEHLPDPCSQWLSQRAEVHVCPADSLRFKELAPSAHGLVVRSYTTVDEAMLASAGNLAVVGRAGVGLNNIDLEACRAHGVRVVHTPQANSRAVVEFVLATLLPQLRPVAAVTAAMPIEEWTSLRDSARLPRQFNETTLGIIGLGRIGSRVAIAAAAIGFHVVYHDLLDIDAPGGCVACDLPLLLAESHVISLHVDAREANRHIIGAGELAAMRDDVVLVNTSRGFVVDAAALAVFLASHGEARAVLDVHEPEPFRSDYPLLGLENVHLYPHLAARTSTALLNMGWVVRDVMAVLEGEDPQFEAGV